MQDQFTRRDIQKGLLTLAAALALGRAVPPARTRLFDFAIAGGWHHGLGKVRRSMTAGERLVLVAEPLNPYDANAIAVHRSDGLMLGYIPRSANEPVARMLADGRTVEAAVVEILRIARDEDVPDDLAFTGFTNGDPRIRLHLVG